MRLDKKLLIAIGIAAGAALVALLVLLLFSIIGWGFIYAILVMALIPIAYAGVQFWFDHDCYDFEDFWSELTSMKTKKSNKNSLIIDDDEY